MSDSQKKKLDISVLVVEDDLPSRIFMETLLRQNVNFVTTAENGKEGLSAYENSYDSNNNNLNNIIIDVIITDIGMPVMDGLEMSRGIKKINPKAHIILTTSLDHKNYMLDAIDLGIDQYIIKPVQKAQFLGALERVSKIINLEREVSKAHEELEDRVKKRTEELNLANEQLIHEITNRIKYSEELKEAKETAEAANRIKNTFLAKVSHELRTPMNGIIGITDILLNSRIDAKQRKFLDMVKISSDNLLRIINDLLDISKIEAGKIKFYSAEFSLSKVLEQISSIFYIEAEHKSLNFIFEIEDKVPDILYGDEGRLIQILNNLISNAIKFTEKGSIEVRVTHKTETDDFIELQFSIKDTGIGIKPENIDSLFKSFSQIDGSLSRKYGGTGLGLAISKE